MTKVFFSLILTFIHSLPSQPGVSNIHSELELSRENYLAWMEHIRPSPFELRWTEINWLPDLGSGIARAAESGKPVLLWTMNGHPFGCT